MSAKVILIVCAQALLIQNAFSQCANRFGGLGLGAPFGVGATGLGGPAGGSAYGRLGANRLGNGLANRLTSSFAGNSLAYDGICAPAVEITATSGGVLPVTSASAIAPNSLVVASENVYEGPLEVAGELPFIGTVGLDGVLPTAGSGAVNHACGNGVTRIVSQNVGAVSSAGPIAPGFGSGIFPGGNMFGQGIGAYGPAGAIGSASPFGYRAGLGGFGNSVNGFAGAYPGVGLGAGLATYGGAGEGNVAVAGEMPVAGNTVVNGQVPIMGTVGFNGAVPAAGGVAISGNCACGCDNSYMY